MNRFLIYEQGTPIFDFGTAQSWQIRNPQSLIDVRYWFCVLLNCPRPLIYEQGTPIFDFGTAQSWQIENLQSLIDVRYWVCVLLNCPHLQVGDRTP